MLFTVTIAVLDTDRKLRVLMWVLVISGTLQAVFGSLMVLSGEESLLLTKKQAYQGSATGTFVNRNHLAGYLEICLAVGVGLLLTQLRSSKASSSRQLAREWIDLLFSSKVRLRVLLAIMVIGLVLTKSRMGNVGFFVSLAICGFIFLLGRERKHLVKGMLIFGSLLLVDLWIVGSWFGLDKVVERLQGTEIKTETRFVAFSDFQPMIQDFKLTGSGLGSFESIYPQYRSKEIALHFDHAHNDYAEFLIETGMIGVGILGLIALLCALHCLRLIIKRRNRLANGAGFAGIMVLSCYAIHSAVDFNLQIPANVATLVIVLAMTMACAPITQSRKRSRAVWRTTSTTNSSDKPEK